MNYYLFQSKFFIIFIAIAAMSFAAIPFMKNSFADVSDTYIKSQLDRLGSEMVLINKQKGTFENSCSSGEFNGIIIDLIKNDTKSLVCKTNKPMNSKMLACARLKNRNYYCADSSGVRCEVAKAPPRGYSCKDL